MSITKSELKDIIKECLLEEGYSFKNDIDIDEGYSLINVEAVESIKEECLLEMIGTGVYIEEKAKFHFAPKFKEDPSLKELYKVAKEAEDELNNEGEATNTGINKFGKLALRILDVLNNINAAIAFPLLILIAPIPGYLINRALSYGMRLGKDAAAAGYANKVINKYEELAKKEQDEKKKKLYESKIEDLKASLTKFNKHED